MEVQSIIGVWDESKQGEEDGFYVQESTRVDLKEDGKFEIQNQSSYDDGRSDAVFGNTVTYQFGTYELSDKKDEDKIWLTLHQISTRSSSSHGGVSNA